MNERGHDPECDKLARYFLGDLGAEQNPRLVGELAQVIQDAIEDWLTSERDRITAQLQEPPQ